MKQRLFQCVVVLPALVAALLLAHVSRKAEADQIEHGSIATAARSCPSALQLTAYHEDSPSLNGASTGLVREPLTAGAIVDGSGDVRQTWDYRGAFDGPDGDIQFIKCWCNLGNPPGCAQAEDPLVLPIRYVAVNGAPAGLGGNVIRAIGIDPESSWLSPRGTPAYEPRIRYRLEWSGETESFRDNGAPAIPLTLEEKLAFSLFSGWQR